MNPRALAAWSGACLLVALAGTNPLYRGAVVVVAAVTAAATALPGRSWRPLQVGLVLTVLGAIGLNGLTAHLGTTVLFEIPDWLPVFGGPVTLEALAYGAVQGLGLVAAVLAFAPWAMALESHEVVDALPRHLERTGLLVASALNLAPRLARSFAGIAESQRMRGWRPRGPRSWGDVLLPTMLTALEDSLQLAEAMEARGFGSGPRSRYAELRWNLADRTVVATSGLAAAGFVASRLWLAVPDWHPFPVLHPPGLEPLAGAACLLLITPALVWRSQNSNG
jgi:energy-coupling factor transport system permease protein